MVHDRAGIVDAVGARQTRRVRGVSRGDESGGDEKRESTKREMDDEDDLDLDLDLDLNLGAASEPAFVELRLGEDGLNPNDENATATGLVVAIPANEGGVANGGGVANREDADPRSDPADAPAGFLGGNDDAARTSSFASRGSASFRGRRMRPSRSPRCPRARRETQ